MNTTPNTTTTRIAPQADGYDTLPLGPLVDEPPTAEQDAYSDPPNAAIAIPTITRTTPLATPLALR
jgi:hypothetical protein